MKRRVTVTLSPPGPLRPIVSLDQHGTLGQCLHQAATAGLRQPIVVDRTAKKHGRRR